MLKYLATAVLALTLGACSFDKNDDSVAAQRDKENKLTMSEFDKVKGLYRGLMTLNDVSYIVTMEIGYIPGESTEKDDKGQPIPKVIPRATLKRINPSSTDYKFDAYIDLKQVRLQLINLDAKQAGPGAGTASTAEASSSGLGPNEIYSIEFTNGGLNVEQKKLVGVIKNSVASRIGDISLEITNQEQESGTNSEQERYDRLKKEYDALAGDYIGDSVLDSKQTEYLLSIRVRVKQVGDFKVPEFYGHFQRTDDKHGTGAVTLAFMYSNSEKAPRLTMTGKARHYPNSDYYANIDGYIQDNTFIGGWITNLGFQGDLNLKRVQTVKNENGVDEVKETPNTGKCLESISPAAYAKLPKDGPIPTPRPKCF